MQQPDVLIAGGGLAGLCSAIHLVRAGLRVLLIEKTSFPHHKVCGEYLSVEILPYLQYLDADPSCLSPVRITELECSSNSGKRIHVILPLGGMGISRYRLDDFLFHNALTQGVDIIQDQVDSISRTGGQFNVETLSGKRFSAPVVLGAFGKRSSLDLNMEREFLRQPAHWLALKGHYKGAYPDNRVGLHFFRGGYCGVSKVEEGRLNICYLFSLGSFKPYKNIEEHRKHVVCSNPELKALFDRTEPLFSKPVSISHISFARKNPVDNHILMIGDSAGLIHPLCGNGMAMAIHSAKIAAELVIRFLNAEVSREGLESLYQHQWGNQFKARLRMGNTLAACIQNGVGRHLLHGIFRFFPGLLPLVIRATHGTPLKLDRNVS